MAFRYEHLMLPEQCVLDLYPSWRRRVSRTFSWGSSLGDPAVWEMSLIRTCKVCDDTAFAIENHFPSRPVPQTGSNTCNCMRSVERGLLFSHARYGTMDKDQQRTQYTEFHLTFVLFVVLDFAFFDILTLGRLI